MQIIKIPNCKIDVRLCYTWNSKLAGSKSVFHTNNFQQWTEHIYKHYPETLYEFKIKHLNEYGCCNLKPMLDIISADVVINTTSKHIISKFLQPVIKDGESRYNPWYNYIDEILQDKYRPDVYISYNKDLILLALQAIPNVKAMDDGNILKDTIIVNYNDNIWYITKDSIIKHNSMLVYDLNKGWMMLDTRFNNLL